MQGGWVGGYSFESFKASVLSLIYTYRKQAGEARGYVDAAADEAAEGMQGLLAAALRGIGEAFEDGREGLLEDALALVVPLVSSPFACPCLYWVRLTS